MERGRTYNLTQTDTQTETKSITRRKQNEKNIYLCRLSLLEKLRQESEREKRKGGRQTEQKDVYLWKQKKTIL